MLKRKRNIMKSTQTPFSSEIEVELDGDIVSLPWHSEKISNMLSELCINAPCETCPYRVKCLNKNPYCG